MTEEDVMKILDDAERRRAIRDKIHGRDRAKRLDPVIVYDLGRSVFLDAMEHQTGDVHTVGEGYAAVCYAAMVMRLLVEKRLAACDCPSCRERMAAIVDAERLATDLALIDVADIDVEGDDDAVV